MIATRASLLHGKTLHFVGAPPPGRWVVVCEAFRDEGVAPTWGNAPHFVGAPPPGRWVVVCEGYRDEGVAPTWVDPAFCKTPPNTRTRILWGHAPEAMGSCLSDFSKFFSRAFLGQRQGRVPSPSTKGADPTKKSMPRIPFKTSMGRINPKILRVTFWCPLNFPRSLRDKFEHSAWARFERRSKPIRHPPLGEFAASTQPNFRTDSPSNTAPSPKCTPHRSATTVAAQSKSAYLCSGDPSVSDTVKMSRKLLIQWSAKASVCKNAYLHFAKTITFKGHPNSQIDEAVFPNVRQKKATEPTIKREFGGCNQVADLTCFRGCKGVPMARATPKTPCPLSRWPVAS